jgi:ankyrin repeat protein
MAAQGNNPNIIIYFKAKYNMSVLSKDSQGNVPLHWACYNSSEEAINFLLSYMDDINIQNNDGKTPLHVAVFTEKPSLIKKLLKKGGDISIKDKDGKTPIILAYELTGADSRVMNLLLSSKPNKTCLQNYFRISSNNNARNKKEDNKTIITPSMYLLFSVISWIINFLLQLNYLPYCYSIIFFFTGICIIN